MSLRIKLIAQTNVSFTRFLKAPKMPFRRINGKGIGFPCSVVKVFYFRYIIVCGSLLWKGFNSIHILNTTRRKVK